MDMTSHTRARKQETRRNVLPTVHQFLEDFSGRGKRTTSTAMSKTQTLGKQNMVMQCPAMSSVLRKLFLSTS